METINALDPLPPLVLEGRSVRLEPLTRDHAAGLREASLPPEIWRWTLSKVIDDGSFERWFEGALGEHARGGLPFAILDRATRRVIGSTRYFDVHAEHRNLEIGHTWLTPSVWRTAVNTECKYLLLTHAFEALGCVRVQLKTNVHNARSRAAIERIGGRFEGIVRKHVVNADGKTWRDTVFFSILDDEWPQAKAKLEGWLAASRSPSAACAP